MSTTQKSIAAFVMKTYEMVSDPKSDGLITWGPANNSFVVSDPIDFSDRILPSFFKHNNFSSFVRQLNTYGFRKVDPDRWEFANEWFLRGQRHLLRNIVRRKLSHNNNHIHKHDISSNCVAEEIGRMKEEQRAMEEEIEGMSKRLDTTELRPQQMMAFLCDLVDHPDILPRILSALRRRPPSASSSPEDSPPWLVVDAGGGQGGGQVGYFESAGPPVQLPYPFSLLEGGF